jgi:hypothetical protein
MLLSSSLEHNCAVSCDILIAVVMSELGQTRRSGRPPVTSDLRR